MAKQDACSNLSVNTEENNGNMDNKYTNLCKSNENLSSRKSSYETSIHECCTPKSIAETDTQSLGGRKLDVKLNKEIQKEVVECKPLFFDQPPTEGPDNIVEKNICCYPKLKYIQPERVKSCKPLSTYKRPDSSLASDTIYKKSYMGLTSDELVKCRPNAIKPKGNITMADEKIDCNTVHLMSYPGHYCWHRVEPIRPAESNLRSDGPIEKMTTHKHDFVPKATIKREYIIPSDSIEKTTEPLAQDTVHKLSFMKPHRFEPVKSFKPNIVYQKPITQMDTNTVHKLSYLPLTPLPKDDMPWAMKAKYTRPTEPIPKDTIYKMSYHPISNYERSQPIRPRMGDKIFASNEQPKQITVYKLSYYPQELTKRREPIRPKQEIKLSDAKMDTRTTNNMSYLENIGIHRVPMILPQAGSINFSGTVDDLTTHKKDFILKPQSKREPIKPKPGMLDLRDGSILNYDTVNKLSYMAPDWHNFQRPTSCKPASIYKKPKEKMNDQTTQKLSYMPFDIQPKEIYPWAVKPKYKKPEQAFDFKTVQKLSYQLPGHFVEDYSCYEFDGCCPPYPPDELLEMHVYPKAEICL